MKSFRVALLFIMTMAVSGCASTSPSFLDEQKIIADGEKSSSVTDEKAKPDFWHQPFGSPSGFDDRAREIEKRLGY